jgi:hypothetical protein
MIRTIPRYEQNRQHDEKKGGREIASESYSDCNQSIIAIFIKHLK